ncbi:MAG: PIN domain-containing protein [Sulfurovum sp.]|nr:PIN domain-containing protein [Sulfurovum sp.]
MNIWRKNMAINVLLDTNIVLDLFDGDRTSSAKSLAKVKELLKGDNTLYVNSDTLTTAFYILRNQKKVTFEESLYAIQETINICELISIELDDVHAALELCIKEKCTDYEDAVQYVCAKKIEAELIVTNDKKFVSLDIELCRTMR